MTENKSQNESREGRVRDPQFAFRRISDRELYQPPQSAASEPRRICFRTRSEHLGRFRA